MRKKIARTKKLIKLRQSELNKEAAKLHQIRARLAEITKKLAGSQEKYFATIDQLNEQRGRNPLQLQLLEDGVDFFKQQLQELIGQQKNWQDQDKSQMENVLAARLSVQSLEKLLERYISQWQAEQEEYEQAEQDQFSLRMAVGTTWTDSDESGHGNEKLELMKRKGQHG